MVPDNRFARVGTMQVQAIMPPLMVALWPLVRCHNPWAFFSRLGSEIP